MWMFKIAQGRLIGPTGTEFAAYAGHPPHVNDPSAVALANQGPLPPGGYTIGPPHDTTIHGPYVLDLTPDPGQEMYGRSLFRIHGDSIAHPGEASEGCVVAARTIREAIWADPDHRLFVQ